MDWLGWDWSSDGWVLAAGALSAVAASLLGNFLVLRRMSMQIRQKDTELYQLRRLLGMATGT